MVGLQVYQFAEHDRIASGLISLCLRLQKENPASALGVMKDGWSSPKGVIDCEELFEVLGFFRSKLAKENFRLVPWFNILSRGGSIGRHNHWQSDFVAVYHVEGEGDLFVEQGGRVHLLAGVPGRMAVFPAYLYHSVPDCITSRRISVSINANKEK